MPSSAPDQWSDAALLETLVDFPGVGDDAGQPDAIRFLRAVSRLARTRAEQVDTANVISVFLLQPGGPSRDDDRFHRQPMLNGGGVDIEGHLWLVGPMAASAHGIRIDAISDDEVFRLVVEDLRMGGVPAVVYDPRAFPAQVRHYPNGLRDPDDCEVRAASFTPIGLEAILDVIDNVHATKLAAPSMQSRFLKLWKTPKTFVPQAEAELLVQEYLHTALIGAFPTCTIRTEQPQPTGRLDIEIEEANPTAPGHFVRHALLELKVLRSYGSTGNTVSEKQARKWVEEGVDQAHAYRTGRGTLASALCCFDMRKSFEAFDCFDHVKDKAAKCAVVLRVWPIYSTLKAYRASV